MSDQLLNFSTFHYITSSLFILITLISTIRNPWWWVKPWDVSRVYVAVVMVILLIVGLVEYGFESWIDKSLLILLAMGIIYHAYKIYPFTILGTPEIKKVSAQTHPISFITANVRMANEETEQILRIIEKNSPDVVLLTETNQWWLDQLEILEKDYLYQIKEPLENTYGIVLYSKLKLSNAEIKYLIDDEVPSIHTHIHLPNGYVIQYIGLHPKPPAPWTNEMDKDKEILKTAKLLSKNDLPTVISGDLNDVGWSPITTTFKMATGLVDPRVGRGFYNTYNAKIPLFRYPIDHFFVDRAFSLLDMKRLPAFGSDHFPVYVKLNVESSKTQSKSSELFKT